MIELMQARDEIKRLKNALAKQEHGELSYGANWSVFNTGACVAEGLTMQEAKDYMTPERIARGWTAVYCVVVKSDDQWPTKQEQGELQRIGEQDCLLDIDERAWHLIVESRGGCRCHLSPPCNACSEPISEEEMNEVGYTYTPQQRKPLTDELLQTLKHVEGALLDITCERESILKGVRAAIAKAGGAV